MRILMTNHSLRFRSGSELYLRDLALALRRRGHEPMVYAPVLGNVADDFRALAIPVTDDLRTIRAPPDVIHGQHHLQTMTALLHFPSAPAVYVCHGFLPWEEAAPRHPRIRAYVAVDDAVRERLIAENGIDPEAVRVIPNFVDLERFRPRPELPPAPRRALIFNSNATEENFASVVREVCSRRGIEVDLVGYAVRHALREPEKILPEYDVVFARARSALEAMAVGCAVIVADPRGMAGPVTLQNFDALRRNNFGVRTLADPVTVASIERALDAYDPAEAVRVRNRVRGDADVVAVAREFDDLFTRFVGAVSEFDRQAEALAVADYLAWLSRQTKLPGFPDWSALRDQLDVHALDNQKLRDRLWRVAEQGGLGTDDAVAALESEAASLRRQLADYEASPFYRAHKRLAGVRPVARVYRWLRRND